MCNNFLLLQPLVVILLSIQFSGKKPKEGWHKVNVDASSQILNITGRILKQWQDVQQFPITPTFGSHLVKHPVQWEKTKGRMAQGKCRCNNFFSELYYKVGLGSSLFSKVFSNNTRRTSSTTTLTK